LRLRLASCVGEDRSHVTRFDHGVEAARERTSLVASEHDPSRVERAASRRARPRVGSPRTDRQRSPSEASPTSNAPRPHFLV